MPDVIEQRQTRTTPDSQESGSPDYEGKLQSLISLNEPFQDKITREVIDSLPREILERVDHAIIVSPELRTEYIRDSRAWISCAIFFEGVKLGKDPTKERGYFSLIAQREGPRQRSHFLALHPRAMRRVPSTPEEKQALTYFEGRVYDLAKQVLGEGAESLGYCVA